ncbi:MAG: DUF4438 domain-containing protein [Clostridiaceae bacterium]|jgi:hypothetical protein|nr:DUF4438 domain-containing protein [Clostridiaceae bacterium]
MILRTNADKLPVLSVQGTIHHPQCLGYLVDPRGGAHVLPQIGGITYNVGLGDSVYGWAGDHVEPGVSLSNDRADDNRALNILSCVGNDALVMSGKAKGNKGTVIGKHLSVELKSSHVLLDFDQDVLELLDVDDTILIKACGQGLELTDFPAITISHLDPRTLSRMELEKDGDQLLVPVTAKVPAQLLGFKTGMDTYRGDFDLVTDDMALLQSHNLLSLKIGDLILIEDYDCSYSPGYRRGARTIGLIVTGDAVPAGQGPGILSLMSSQTGQIVGRIDKTSSLNKYLDRI